jgi:hypothetical protein
MVAGIGRRRMLGWLGCNMADHSLEAFRKGTGSLDDFVKKSEEYQRELTGRRLAESRLRGEALVRKNEEYIAKHREAEYQRQKAEAEKKLGEALRSNKFRSEHPLPLDETSRWFDRRSAFDRGQPFIEPGPSYKPREYEPDLFPRKGETMEQFKERQGLYKGLRRTLPEM